MLTGSVHTASPVRLQKHLKYYLKSWTIGLGIIVQGLFYKFAYLFVFCLCLGRKFNGLGQLFTKGFFKSLMDIEDSVKNLLKYETIIATMDVIYYILLLSLREILMN